MNATNLVVVDAESVIKRACPADAVPKMWHRNSPGGESKPFWDMVIDPAELSEGWDGSTTEKKLSSV